MYGACTSIGYSHKTCAASPAAQVSQHGIEGGGGGWAAYDAAAGGGILAEAQARGRQEARDSGQIPRRILVKYQDV